jgi:NACHT domain-containing protein/restriction endonuclease/pentapeptide repeat protein
MRKSKSSKKMTDGKVAVEKGRKFEDEVADLYRLLGAEVIQNIEVCQKKVDILATFSLQGSPTKHKVIVECKDEKKAVDANQRVMQFQGLLDIARQTREADSAEIVTRVAWGDAAKGFAKKAGISLLTYAEKVSQLIDFRFYLKDLIRKFKEYDSLRPSEPPLAAYYVDLSAEHIKPGEPEKIPLIDEYIAQWLQQNDARSQLAIFGEYGAGKSSLCQKIAHDLAASYLHDPTSTRIPILLNLRDFIGTIKIEAYIASFLDQECGVANPKFELFRAMNNAGLFLLIFDGLDEMAVKVDKDTLEQNLIEIEKLAVSSKSKVILTSRPEYFITSKEEEQALNQDRNIFKARVAQYKPIKILPWGEDQINRFLQLRVPLISEATQPWTYYRDRIKRINKLSDLSQRPVLLEMIVKTLPGLIENKSVINLPNLYQMYLLEEIRRQKILKRRTLLIPEEARLLLLQELAADLYAGSIPAITFLEALHRVESAIRPPRQELEAYTREFLTNSFLIRRGDTYHFSHKSILEYLVARQFNREIELDSPNIAGRTLLQPVIVDFLTELDPDEQTLWDWINHTRTRAHVGGIYLGGNAATLLCALSKDALSGKDLSGTSLTGADLSGADLRKTNLKGTILAAVNLRNALFYKENLQSANISNANFTFYSLIKPTTHTEKAIMDLTRNNATRVEINRYNNKRMLLIVTIEQSSITEAEEFKQELSTLISAPAALYHNEYERLFRSNV